MAIRQTHIMRATCNVYCYRYLVDEVDIAQAVWIGKPF